MRGIWWSLLLVAASAGGCAGPHFGGAVETSVAVGICFDSGSPGAAEGTAGIREQVARQLARQDVELVGCLGAEAEAGHGPKLEWQRPREFEGMRAAAPLPRRPPGARFGYSFERGPLHLTVIETADPMAAGSKPYLWLMEDLSLAAQPWKVVILSRPIVSLDPVRVDPERMDLAELLAREGVALAIATGAPAYCRTAPIGEARQESVRYVILGCDCSGAPPKSPEAKPSPVGRPAEEPPEWAACTINEPCFCKLDVKLTGLRWEAFDLHGRLLDLLDLPSPPAAGEAAEGAESEAQTFTWSEVLRTQ
jgi:hypothetical protein